MLFRARGSTAHSISIDATKCHRPETRDFPGEKAPQKRKDQRLMWMLGREFKGQSEVGKQAPSKGTRTCGRSPGQQPQGDGEPGAQTR